MTVPRAVDRQAGFALLMVLWSLLLLSTIATGLNRDSRDVLRLARNGAASARAEALAEAGVVRAVYGLMDLRPDERWRGDDRPYALALGGGTVEVRVQDEAGLIDLNAAPEELLAALFAVLGAPEDRAADIARSIVERRASPESGGPFEAAEALATLPGLGHDLAARAVPFLTVVTRQRTADPTVAPLTVLHALGTDPQAIAATLAARARGETSATTQRRLFRIRAEGVVDGARFIRVATVRLTHAPERPYLVLSWRRGTV